MKTMTKSRFHGRTHLPSPAEAAEYFHSRIRFTLGPGELKTRMERGMEFNLIDVRNAEAFDLGHLPGARNLPKASWETCRGLSKDRVNILYCSSPQCHLAPEAALFFATKGYPVMEMEGGYWAWAKSYGYNVETSPVSPAGEALPTSA